jgi:hypothetical protein
MLWSLFLVKTMTILLKKHVTFCVIYNCCFMSHIGQQSWPRPDPPPLIYSHGHKENFRFCFRLYDFFKPVEDGDVVQGPLGSQEFAQLQHLLLRHRVVRLVFLEPILRISLVVIYKQIFYWSKYMMTWTKFYLCVWKILAFSAIKSKISSILVGLVCR